MKKNNNSRGFTLVEIAIVLVIIGLLLGGILKGQELINNAKVRAIADRQNSLKVAWFAFIDRFAALPGDYIQADVYISGAAGGDGNGTLIAEESALAFQHLSAAGFLRCPQCTETSTTVLPVASNSLINSYGGVMSIWHDQEYYAVRAKKGTVVANVPARLMVHTGARIPSNILAEVDRKIDDGVPNTGDLNLNEYDPSGTPIVNTTITSECMKIDSGGTAVGVLYHPDPQYWRPAGSSPPIWQDCGASVYI